MIRPIPVTDGRMGFLLLLSRKCLVFSEKLDYYLNPDSGGNGRQQTDIVKPIQRGEAPALSKRFCRGFFIDFARSILGMNYTALSYRVLPLGCY